MENNGQFTKGNIPHNKGLKGYSNSGTFVKGKKHKGWKDKPSYSGIHKWIVRNYGRANECNTCNVKGANRYEWANLSKEYKRDILDWKQVCKSCHTKMDMTENGRARIAKSQSKPVACYKNGEWILSYLSATSFAIIFNIDRSYVAKSCRSLTKVIKGFKLEYITTK